MTALFYGEDPDSSPSQKYLCPAKGQDHPMEAWASVYLVAAKGVKGRGAGSTLHMFSHRTLFHALQIPYLGFPVCT